MHRPLRPGQREILRGHPAINDEFALKVGELDRRLKLNGLNYNEWDTLTDHQQGIFVANLFLDGGCAGSVDEYVDGALNGCDCPDVHEELHSHSPVLMSAIEEQQNMLPVRVAMHTTNESFNSFIDSVIKTELTESEDA